MQAPVLHAWVRDDLARLAKVGITPTLAEVVWLSDLAKAAHTPPGRGSYCDPASPVDFCGVRFWPLTMLAQRWFVTWFESFDGQQDMQGGVYLFAHAKSRPGDTSLRDLGDMDAVSAAVSEWLNALPVRPDQLPALQDLLQSFNSEQTVPEPKDDQHAEEPGEMSETPEERAASLCVLFEGTTPEYWLTGVSDAVALALAAARVSAENGSGAWANSPVRTRRIASYMNAVKWIVRRAEGKGV